MPIAWPLMAGEASPGAMPGVGVDRALTVWG